MPDSRLDEIREHLKELKARLARGDVDEAAYFRMKKELLSDFSPQERQALETGSQVAVGPSGLHTHVPSLAELELAPGTVLFDQWRIVRELGRGGFGVVFEAAELHLGETQAVKVLDPAMSSRPELLARFRREVTVMRRLERAFWMAQTEVTQAQWCTVMGTEPSRFARCGDECPVERVSWYDAVTFANRLSKMNGYEDCYELTGCEGGPGSDGDYRCTTVELTGLDCGGYRLPTEAEWEYAARATTKTALYTGPLTIRGNCDGPKLDEIGWYCGNSGSSTHPAGRKKPNEWGLYDMLGNVWEWTWNWFADYEATSVRDPLGPSRGSPRVIRGGSWLYYARNCRAAGRYRSAPGYRNDYVGFRLVRTYP